MTCELPECRHRLCVCGHAECGHADENVQPNCSDCQCNGFREKKPPKILNRIADKVLAYRVPARTKKAKKRARKRRQIRRESCI